MSRGGWVLTFLSAASLAFLAPDADRSLADLRSADLTAALVSAASLVQVMLSGWVLLIVALTAVHAPAPFVRAVTPRLLRRALFVGAAGALALAPAHADPASTPDRAAHHDLAGLRLPDRPVAAAARVVAAPARVVVRPGDTLWAIAARSLPDDADAGAIAAACESWYAANRDVIGPDPDLIFPTQRLVTPPGKDPT